MNERPPVNLRGTHDLGAVIGYAYRIYGAHFRTLFLIAMITAPLVMLGAVVQRQISSDEAATAAGLAFQVPEALVGLVATGALIYAVHAISGGIAPQAGASVDFGLAKFGALITSMLLAGVLTLASLFSFPALAIWWLVRRSATVDGRRDAWLLLPGVLTAYLVIRWVFAPQAVIIGGRRNWSALDLSAYAVRGYWWRTLGILLVAGLIQLGPLMIVAGAAALPPLADATIAAAVSALVLPFSVAAQTLLFYDLLARKDDDASAHPVSAA